MRGQTTVLASRIHLCSAGSLEYPPNGRNHVSYRVAHAGFVRCNGVKARSAGIVSINHLPMLVCMDSHTFEQSKKMHAKKRSAVASAFGRGNRVEKRKEPTELQIGKLGNRVSKILNHQRAKPRSG